ncbi:ribosomal protein L1 [Nadsonia fulvescens var. elongata DSM 6958]|uniref:Ribosomal protein L1 n=1 Tax=Nadsonia fulvescens var. elongata DSM 6958 TaxID=857566 RepID=A0A1E3PME1_9ASCO|nr:ribosomal protein L1 [Nadsonia fulvescens var. elongata DSM 6958]
MAQITQYLPTAQSKKSVKALLAHVESVSAEPAAGAGVPVYLQITTKFKEVVPKRVLIPHLVTIPHRITKSSTKCSVLLIVKDPQHKYKQVLQDPKSTETKDLFAEILSLSKLKARARGDRNKQLLLKSFDLIVADYRVIDLLPDILGKVFYLHNKRTPIPIHLSPPLAIAKPVGGQSAKYNTAKSQTAKKQEDLIDPTFIRAQVRGILKCTPVALVPSCTISIKVGFAGFPVEHLLENSEAVVRDLCRTVIKKGWENVKAVHIKTPESASLPMYKAED